MKIYILSVLLFVANVYGSGSEKGHNAEGAAAGEHKDSHSWGYLQNNGPDLWADLLPKKCGVQKKRQSPIDIQKGNTKYDDLLADVDLLDQAPAMNYTLTNNGHSVNLGVTDDILVSGGGLPEGFKVFGVHFHWGAGNNNGSEHTLDGKQFPLEVHIVNYDAGRFASIDDALAGQDSLAVLGTFWKVGPQANQALQPIIQHLAAIKNQDAEISIPRVNVKALLPSITKNYYRYLGSLTTPGCNENVIWTMFDTTNTLSADQLAEFRTLTGQVGSLVFSLVDNFRPTQPLHGRVVSRSFVIPGAVAPTRPPPASTASATQYLTALVMSLLLMLFK